MNSTFLAREHFPVPPTTKEKKRRNLRGEKTKKNGAPKLRNPNSGTLKPRPHPKQIASSAGTASAEVVVTSAADVETATAGTSGPAGSSTAVLAVDVVVSIVSAVALAVSLATSAAAGTRGSCIKKIQLARRISSTWC